MATTNDPLVALATRALDFVEDGSVVGLGAGRAASAFVHVLAGRVREGLRVRGVPASEETARLARELGLGLVGLETELDLTVDGADEVDRELNLIKGYGCAFVRERILASATPPPILSLTTGKPGVILRNPVRSAFQVVSLRSPP